MKRPILTSYQCVIGFSDLLLMATPQFTLRMMGLHAPEDALPYLSFIGAFVFSVGIACLYGAYIASCDGWTRTLATVWLLTTVTRATVALFVTGNVLTGALAVGWMTVAIMDAGCAVLQTIGLRRGWLNNAATSASK